MGYARKHVVLKGVSGTYHVMNRCVRQLFLCGIDSFSQQNFEYRKQWIVDRIFFLSEIFAIDIVTYAIMSNHYHIVLVSQPQRVEKWSDEEIARRWLTLYPPKKYRLKKDEDYLQSQINLLSQSKERIVELRERLENISWFMGRLNEFIARKANKEEERKGRFWEGRFKCQRLLDEASILTCMTYVDLNPIRADVAKTPETSEFTGAHDRIIALQENETINNEELQSEVKNKAEEKQKRKQPEEITVKKSSPLLPLDRNKEESPLDITAVEYIELLDWTGRQLRSDKRGFIPSHLPPILARLNVNEKHWLETVPLYGTRFRRIVGRFNAMLEALSQLNQKWLVGLKFSNSAFTT